MSEFKEVSPLVGWPVTVAIPVVAYSAVLVLNPALWLCAVLTVVAAGVVAGLITLILLRAGAGEGWAYAAMIGCTAGSVAVMPAYGVQGMLGVATLPVAVVVVVTHLVVANRRRWAERKAKR